MSEKQILSLLLTDESETLNRLVEKAQRIFKINKKTGEVLLLPPRSKLTDKQLITVHLLGKYFSSKLELSSTDSLSFDELRKLSGLEESSISARISELRKEGLAETGERGVYRINYQSLEAFSSAMEEIEGSIITAPSVPPIISARENIDSLNLASNTDGESIVLTLYANGAPRPPDNLWLSADEIIEWARNHGSPMRPDTVKKWTLPQDPKLRQFITRKKNGKAVLYQLNRNGIKEAQRLLDGEASGKS